MTEGPKFKIGHLSATMTICWTVCCPKTTTSYGQQCIQNLKSLTLAIP